MMYGPPTKHFLQITDTINKRSTKTCSMNHTFNLARAYSSNSSRLNSNDGTSVYMSTSNELDDDGIDDAIPAPLPTPRLLTSERGTGRPATFIIYCLLWLLGSTFHYL